MKFFNILIILSVIISCSSPKKENIKKKENNIVSNPIDPKLKVDTITKRDSSNNKFVTVGDSVQIPTFEIKVNLTRKTNRRLTRNNETIIVGAYFRGQPKDTTSQEFLKWKEIFIGKHEIELSDKRIAKFEKIKISKTLFEKLSNENFEVLINVRSGRKSSNNNLIDCEILQKPIMEIVGKQIELKGKLL